MSKVMARLVGSITAAGVVIAGLAPIASVSAASQAARAAVYSDIPAASAVESKGNIRLIAPSLGIDPDTIETKVAGPRELAACSFAENKVDPSEWALVTTGKGDTAIRYSVFGYKSGKATNAAWESLVTNLPDCERTRTVDGEIRTTEIARSLSTPDPAYWMFTKGTNAAGKQTSIGIRFFRKVDNVIQRFDGVRVGDESVNALVREGLRQLSNYQAREYRQVLSDFIADTDTAEAGSLADAQAADDHPHIDYVIDAIRSMERNTGSQTSHGTLWDLTETNSLGANGSWIIDNHNCWEITDVCDNTAEMQKLTSTIRNIVGSGEQLVDLSGLTALPDGAFRQAIIDGLRDAAAAGRDPVVRLLWGRTPLNDIRDKEATAFYRDLQNAAPGIRVVVGVASDTLVTGGYFWNHSKIVAADGRTAFVSGINMWAKDYLQSTHPVTDLGMVVTGPAALSSQQFLDVQWRHLCANQGFVDRWSATILPKEARTDCPATMTPLIVEQAAAANVGDVPVLALGRGGRIYDGRHVGTGTSPAVSWKDRLATTCPGIFNVMNGGSAWDGRNPADTGLRALVASANKSITIFQQMMTFPCPVNTMYDVRLFDALAKQIDRGLPVKIVTSNESSNVLDAAGYGATPTKTVQKVLIERLRKLGNSKLESQRLVCRNVMVAPLRVTSTGKWPEGKGLLSRPGLHSKLIMVDDAAVSIGSQNLYPNELAEFSYIVEDKQAVAELKERFVDPVVKHSAPAAAPCPISLPDEPTKEGNGPAIAVSLGDSFISGEAGRWGGNAISKAAVPLTDRLGPTAYWDGGTGEKIKNCHRSAESQVAFWPGSVNLACSGAITKSQWKGIWPIGNPKPGIDRQEVRGVDGQLTQLREVARTNDVKVIYLSIGGNDFGFSRIILACSSAFTLSNRVLPNYCKDSKVVKRAFSKTALDELSTKVAKAIGRTVQTMKELGYADDDWSLVVQNYPSILPDGKDFRYPETNDRISKGGCGFWNADVDYINAQQPKLSQAIWHAVDQARQETSVDIERMDLMHLFEGRRLCEKGTDVADNYTDAAEFEKVAEYVQSLRVNVLGTEFSVFEVMHPNYFGQQLLQECAEAAWNNGDVRSGVCVSRGTKGATPPSDDALAWFTADER